jgi:hypothetical protein
MKRRIFGSMPVLGTYRLEAFGSFPDTLVRDSNALVASKALPRSLEKDGIIKDPNAFPGFFEKALNGIERTFGSAFG